MEDSIHYEIIKRTATHSQQFTEISRYTDRTQTTRIYFQRFHESPINGIKISGFLVLVKLSGSTVLTTSSCGKTYWKASKHIQAFAVLLLDVLIK